MSNKATDVCQYVIECLDDAPKHLSKEMCVALKCYIRTLKLELELTELENEVEQ